MRHPNNSFPATLKDGRVVLDEKFVCGHLRTEHQGRLRGAEFGHGRCKLSWFCRCEKFTWVAHIFQK
jgi:hypothetical protein